MTITRVSDVDPRDTNLDLEKGHARELRATRPTQPWEDNLLDQQPQEHRTIMVVNHRSSSSSTGPGESFKICNTLPFQR